MKQLQRTNEASFKKFIKLYATLWVRCVKDHCFSNLRGPFSEGSIQQCLLTGEAV